MFGYAFMSCPRDFGLNLKIPYEKVDNEGDEDGVVVAPERVRDDGAEDRGQVAGSEPGGDIGRTGNIGAVQDGLEVHHQVRADAIECCAL